MGKLLRGAPIPQAVFGRKGGRVSVDIYSIQSRRYAIRRYDGRLFPERYTCAREAGVALRQKLGNGAPQGLAWIVVIYGGKGGA